MSSRRSGTASTSERRRTWTSKGAGPPDPDQVVRPGDPRHAPARDLAVEAVAVAARGLARWSRSQPLTGRVGYL
jgi:hypothetical protein